MEDLDVRSLGVQDSFARQMYDETRAEPASMEVSSSFTRQKSMSSLILWNITKAIQKHPNIDLLESLCDAQERLEKRSHNVNVTISQEPVERHLACALLAWHNLGHHNAESLYQFYDIKMKDKEEQRIVEDNLAEYSLISYEGSKCSRSVDSPSFDRSVGPVVLLPAEPKIVMPCCHGTGSGANRNQPDKRPRPKGQGVPDSKQRGVSKATMNKIEKVCCMEPACLEKLNAVDTNTKEMRLRAQRLAKREAQRLELLERAEAAWRDLDLGYQRRLKLAEDKEADIAKQIKKLIEDRNNNKTECQEMVKDSKKLVECVEKSQKELAALEREVINKAQAKLKLAEEAAKGDCLLADEQCKAAQLERDLQFKEQQATRTIHLLETQLDSQNALVIETERATRAELAALMEQVSKLSEMLIQEDEQMKKVLQEMEPLNEEKMALMSDLEGCKEKCDRNMRSIVDNLKAKQEELKQLQLKHLECRCKVPTDAEVEVKRTPSLAALCKCSPEDRVMKSCSCTSLRSSLLNSLLSDLFNGLQSEMGDVSLRMPCQILKCLDDHHNWDRSSVVKTNVRNFFSQLLVGELNIAIATSIEKYHAKWIGQSCADYLCLSPDPGDELVEGWQDLAIERRAQTLANQLAEKMFKDRADQLTRQAKAMIKSAPPPCTCKNGPCQTSAMPLLINPVTSKRAKKNITESSTITPKYWQGCSHEVTQLRLQVHNLKKSSVKIDDLKQMEDKINKMAQHASGTDKTMDDLFYDEKSFANRFSKNIYKKRITFANNTKKSVSPSPQVQTLTSKRNTKVIKNMEPSYAVNVCLCDHSKNVSSKSSNFDKSLINEEKSSWKQKVSKDITPNVLCHDEKIWTQRMSKNITQNVQSHAEKSTWKQKLSTDIISNTPSIKQTKPISEQPLENITNVDSTQVPEKLDKIICKSKCICFHKVPSNTSIDKLLGKLVQWETEQNENDSENDSKNEIHEKENFPEKLEKEYSSTKIIHDNKTDQLSLKNSRTSCQAKSKIVSSHTVSHNDENLNKTQENILDLATESEYMGEVNLDKSTEDFYKNINSQTTKNQSTQKQIGQPENTPFKCIDTLPCSSIIKTKEKQETIETTFKDHITIQENFCPSPYIDKYDIKLLGVTLTKMPFETSSENNIKNEHKDDYNLSKKQRKNNKLNLNKNCNITKLNLGIGPNQYKETIASKDPLANNEQVKNKENVKEYKDIVICDSRVDKQNQKLSILHKSIEFSDKFVDVQSLYESDSDNSEKCICCSKSELENSELEKNTFKLLAEHLKHKIQEFRQNKCVSSCITPEDEKSIFSKIIIGVKEIIGQTTNKLKCNCQDEKEMEASWNRANILLQEYLKSKLQRVQCACNPGNDASAFILPNVLEEVCNRIDIDLQRLKNICLCSKEQTYRRSSNIDLVFPEIPEKDVVTNNQVVDEPVQTSERLINVPSPLKFCNKSVQELPNLNMQDKICNAMETFNTETQTNKVVNFVCDPKKREIVNITEPIFKVCSSFERVIDLDIEIKEVSNDCTNLMTNFTKSVEAINMNNSQIEAKEQLANDEQQNTPYIGYTLHCSCDNALPACVCAKSKLQLEEIDSNFNRLEVKNDDYKFSYIMNSVMKVKMPENLNPIIELCSCDDNKITSRDIEVNTSIDKELTLKQISNIDVKTKNSTSNTNFEEPDCRKTESLFMEDVIEWYNSFPTSPMTCSTGKNDDVLKNQLSTPIKHMKLSKSDTQTQNTDHLKSCDCDSVPVCHVKMLLDNIESKLVHSKCTCDSLSSKVCPVHSNRHFY